MRCGGDVVLAVKSRPESALEAQYKSEAYGIAQNAGARLVWDTVVVPTEAESGLVDRARALEPGSDVVKGTLLGVVRPLAKPNVQEIWCTSVDVAGNQRCETLVGALLGSSVSRVAISAASATTASGTASGTANATTNGTAGGANVFGRSITLPSTCAFTMQDEGGEATCKDQSKLSWHRFDAMDDATQAVAATLEAVGESGDGSNFACTVAGEVGRCEAHAHAVAGITYLDGKPLVALCIGPADPVNASLCKQLIVAKPPK